MKKEDTTTTASQTRAVDLLKRAQRELAAFRKLKEIAEAERDELLAALKDCVKCLTLDSDSQEDFAPEIQAARSAIQNAERRDQ